MDQWFADIVEAVVRRALLNADPDLQTALASLTAHRTLASSPLVRVLAVDASRATIEIRGEQPLLGGSISPVVRVEVHISRTAAPGGGITIQPGWSVSGDLRIERAGVFVGEAAFGWAQNRWTGRGALQVDPAQFGLDIALRGLSDDGLALAIDLTLPAPLPLGPTGLALVGIGGEFAYNFKPDTGPNPDADAYVRWARDHNDLWVPVGGDGASISEAAVGLGINAGIGDVSSNGFLLKLQPIGLLVLVPGPVFVFGGEGKLLDTSSILAKGYVTVDVASGSLAMGLGATIAYPPEVPILKAHGTFDAFFSFTHAGLWYLHLGTYDEPIAAQVTLSAAFDLDAEAYLVIDAGGIAFGVGVSVDEDIDALIARVHASAGARVDATLGWDPIQVEGHFALWGEIALEVFGIDFRLSAKADATGYLPRPIYLVFDVDVELDLPWPLPDVGGTARLEIGKEPTPPSIATPLRSADAALPAGEQLQIGAIHALTGRQWQLEGSAASPDDPDRHLWPDTEIVIPFNQPTADATNIVQNQYSGPRPQGGYEMTHTISQIELRNLSADGQPLVDKLHAVWAASPDGASTGRLHLLGTNPFDWLAPHTSVVKSVLPIAAAWEEQRFGIGPAEPLTSPRTFGRVTVTPIGAAELVNDFGPALPTRVLRCRELEISFTQGAHPRNIDELVLLVLASPAERGGLPVPAVSVQPSRLPHRTMDGGALYGDLSLMAVVVPVGTPGSSKFVIHTDMQGPLLLVGIRYRLEDDARVWTLPRTLLVPARYRLTVKGTSRGEYVHADTTIDQGPEPDPIAWQQTQEFIVDNPPSLRPYIRTATIGDPRIFRTIDGWDPTPMGLGFPIYRGYVSVVRFLVPYLHGIFEQLVLRVRQKDGSEVENEEKPFGPVGGESSLPHVSQEWIDTHGGTVPPDEEVHLAEGRLSVTGPATVSLAYHIPGGTEELQLDEWMTYVSAFDGFVDHLAWNATSVTVHHAQDGIRRTPACPIAGPASGGTEGRTAFAQLATARTLHELNVEPTPANQAWLLSVLLAWVSGLPDELTSAPNDWLLPAALGTQLGPLDASTPLRFARFAATSGCTFGDPADKLPGLGNVASATTVETLLDGAGRPYALWLRTPEPVDWRRVTGTLRIDHVDQTGDCPQAAAARRPLELEVEFLPAPDAASAFVVGSFAGDRIRLPRGIYNLELTFAQAPVGDLPALRPGAGIGLPEVVTLRFVQASGADWPLPKRQFTIPEIYLQRVRDRFGVDPGPLRQRLENGLTQAFRSRIDKEVGR